MKKFGFSAIIYLTATLSTAAHAEGQHHASIGLGSLGFTWKEFATEDDERRTVVVEDDTLSNLSAGYSFSEGNRNFALTYDYASGDVAYMGEKDGGPEGVFFPSVSNYTLNNIEGELGTWFEVDYIKPYAAIIGGYHTRDRNINPLEGEVAGLDEQISYLYWGVKLEAEIFSWDDFSWDIGGQFDRTVEGKNDLTVYGDPLNYRSGEVTLQPIVSLSYYTRLHYEFLGSWRATLSYESRSGDMDESYVAYLPGAVNGVPAELGTFQPESEQETTLVELSLRKSF